MRRSYLRIRRNRTHSGRPHSHSREQLRERDANMPHEGEPRPAQVEGESDQRAVAADLFPRRDRD
jgi:hypothetical protein